jgi:hypothetical protein
MRRDTAIRIVDEEVVEALEKSQAKSQGFILDSELRAKLEKYSKASTYISHLLATPSKITRRTILTSGEVEFVSLHSKQMVPTRYRRGAMHWEEYPLRQTIEKARQP